MAEPIRVHILKSNGDISDTIIFVNDPEHTKTVIHPDDSIRTVKMKILYELHQGKRANEIQLRPSYEELYLYAFTEEETNTRQLFDVLGFSISSESDPAIPKHVIEQILDSHPKAKSLVKRLPAGDTIHYADFESILSENRLTLSVKTPLGIQGGRDATFETDPFAVEKHKAYLTEHANFHYFDDSLLLNYGDLIENTIYLCLADRVYESVEQDATDYVSRYYFPGLYKAGVHSKETLVSKRAALVKHTVDLLSEARLQYYQSIDTFYQIATSSEYSAAEYVTRGIQSATLRLKNADSRTTNLELLFRNMHCSRDVPYIKFNPGNRRENLYRFYFERTTRTGNKIPYLSRAHIMRMSKETGKSQQISAYFESVVLSDRLISNCYAHFERSGDVLIQLFFKKPINERTLDDIMLEKVAPLLSKLARDIKQTGFILPEYKGIRDPIRTQVANMEFVVKAAAKKQATWETVPCVHSICVLNKDSPGSPLKARLKRVENFKEMDAARILVTELYGEVQYGDLTMQDIVEELTNQRLTESEDAARMLIAEVLSNLNEMDGEIVERPGFPIELSIDNDEKVIEFRVSDITSIRYLDTISVYIDAMIKTTQLLTDKTPIVKRLNKLCKKSRKFKEVEAEPQLTPTLLSEAVRAPHVITIAGPRRFAKTDVDDDFFAQFATEDGEEEEYAPGSKYVEETGKEDGEDDVGPMFARLHQNAKKITEPVVFDDELEPEQEKYDQNPKQPNAPVMFDSDESDAELDAEPEPIATTNPKKQRKRVSFKRKDSAEDSDIEGFEGSDVRSEQPESPVTDTTTNTNKYLPFHSKSAKFLPTDPYALAGMPLNAMAELSNFYPLSVIYNGLEFPTVEHAFQSQKYTMAGAIAKKNKTRGGKPKGDLKPKGDRKTKGGGKTKKNQSPNKSASPKSPNAEQIIQKFTVNGNWSALDAKKAGGRKEMEKYGFALNIQKWETESVAIMEALIRSKIERHPEIRKILRVVKELGVKLAHFSRSDMKWGCHLSEDKTKIKKGENLLGKIYTRFCDTDLINELKVQEPKVAALVPKVQEPKAAQEPKAQEPKPGPIMFDDDDDDNYGGAKKHKKGEDPDSDEEEDNRIVPDGLPLKPVNPILKKLKKRDPVLFMSKPSGNYKAFSVSCQPTSRHPVILTKDEFDRTDKSAYEHHIKYGSDPDNQHYFICPRFWCFLTNAAISESDVKAGKCGEIIPKSAKVIPKGAYVYELNKDAKYPGFAKDTRPDGKCYPCCSKNWDGEKQRKARERCQNQMVKDNVEESAVSKKKSTVVAVSQKTAQYIYSLDTYPVPIYRWGYLPIPVQLFLNVDYKPAVDPNNPAVLLPGKKVLLRCGVEQPQHQSFMGVFAHLYAHRQGLDTVPSVDEFRGILSKAVDLDVFSRAHNGSLLSAFFPKTSASSTTKKKDHRKKYENSEFAQHLNLSNKSQKRHFDDAILAYENFLAFLSDKTSPINHQYLWDLVCGDNARIIPRGLNLVILEIKANDIIDRIELVCPTNLYSSNQFDAAKDTVLVLKHDDIYEPVFLYESTAASPNVVRFLESGKIPKAIMEVLKNIEYTTKRFCPGLPSLPSIYRFANPMPLQKVLDGLEKIGAKVKSQVVNYQGKTIGLTVKERDHKSTVYVPCAPSAVLEGQQVLYMDDLSIPHDYIKTTEALNRISATARIPCKPRLKIKEDGLVVGFLTEANQFVPIKPNEDIIMDGLKTYQGVDTFAADKTAATKSKGDRKREKMTKYITLESQFYHAFRNRVRILLNQFTNLKWKRDIKKVAEDPTAIYSQKIKKLEKMIEELIEDYVVFVDIDKDTLMDLAYVNECDDEADESKTCRIIKENGIAQLVVPKWHLLSKYDNEVIYKGRLADELIRNDRVKAFMYDTVNRLNARNVEYSIQPDEFILVQSALTPDYFSELESRGDALKPTPYAKHTNYELANPSISVLYPNEKIPLDEQYQGVENADQLPNNCLEKMVPVIGNQHQIWSRIFSKDARELVYRNTVQCTYQPIIRIANESLGEKWTEQEIRQRLATSYSKLFEKTPELLAKVAGVMRKQGKSKMFERIAQNPKMDSALQEFESIVISDTYHLTDMDLWALAMEYKLPIILFNPNGLKGFFPKPDVQWLRLYNTENTQTKYHFVRSNIGSYPNKIYEYHLIVPSIRLSDTKEFEGKVVESTTKKFANTYGLEEALSKIAFVETKALKAKK